MTIYNLDIQDVLNILEDDFNDAINDFDTYQQKRYKTVEIYRMARLSQTMRQLAHKFDDVVRASILSDNNR